MATAPVPIPFPRSFPPMPAVARILSRFDREQLEGFIAVALDLLDTLDGPADPDTPDYRPCSDGLPGEPDDHEPSGDEKDMAWREWTGLPAKRRGGHMDAGPPLVAAWNGHQSEDDEADDFDEDDELERLDYAE